MPVTAGPVPGVTSDLRRVRMDPGRFRSGRWMLLTEGLLVGAFGIGGLVSAALHPHAGPTGAPILGLTSTAPHSAMLLALGVAAIAAIGKRHAAVAVTALSAVAYTLLLFIGAVATARATPTLFGFHAAGIVLHGLLGVVNFALLMWLIPDELGDEAWVPRRGRDQDEQQPSDAAPQPGAGPPIPAPATLPGSSPAAPGAGHTPSPRSRAPAEASPPVDVGRSPGAVVEPPGGQGTNASSAPGVERSAHRNHFAARAAAAVPSPAAVAVALTILAAAVGVVVWIRCR